MHFEITKVLINTQNEIKSKRCNSVRNNDEGYILRSVQKLIQHFLRSHILKITQEAYPFQGYLFPSQANYRMQLITFTNRTIRHRNRIRLLFFLVRSIHNMLHSMFMSCELYFRRQTLTLMIIFQGKHGLHTID